MRTTEKINSSTHKAFKCKGQKKICVVSDTCTVITRSDS